MFFRETSVRSPAAEPASILRWPMLSREQHQHIPISITRRIACRVSQVNAAWRQPDVVYHHLQLLRRDHTPNLFVDPLEHLPCSFDPRACRRPDVELHLPGIHIRKEISAHHWNQCERTQGHHCECNQCHRGVPQCPLQSAFVLLCKLVEPMFKPLVKPPDEASAQRRLLLLP